MPALETFESLAPVDVAASLRSAFNQGFFDRSQRKTITTKANFIRQHSANIADQELILDMYRSYHRGYESFQ